jgi:hypothetical protein
MSTSSGSGQAGGGGAADRNVQADGGLPFEAIFVAAVINRELPEGMPAAIATAGSMIAGIATVEALLQAHW